jgi:hypothetical protein
MTKQFIALLLLVVLFSCEKDSFQSKPGLSLNKVSSTFVPAGFDLQISMRLTDKEGDFVDTIWVNKTTTRCSFSNFQDSLLYSIPKETPRSKNFDGEVLITFTYAIELQPRCNRNDTAIFSFWMKDKAGNKSDTVKTPAIIIQR